MSTLVHISASMGYLDFGCTQCEDYFTCLKIIHSLALFTFTLYTMNWKNKLQLAFLQKLTNYLPKYSIVPMYIKKNLIWFSYHN